MEFLVIAACFGIATGVIGKAKGQSFFIWLLVGTLLPLLGLVAVILSRREQAPGEPVDPALQPQHVEHRVVALTGGPQLVRVEVHRPGRVRRPSLSLAVAADEALHFEPVMRDDEQEGSGARKRRLS